MDIDDILREVDPASQSIPPETPDLQALTRAWVAERSSPELLQYARSFSFKSTMDGIFGYFVADQYPSHLCTAGPPTDFSSV